MQEKQNMSILHITPQPPSDRGGGGLGVAQTLQSLFLNNYQIDYVGPEIKEEKYAKLYRNMFILNRGGSRSQRLFDILRGITNSRYRAWLDFVRNTDLSSYEVIVMDFTKQDYCLDALKGKYIVVRVHNVEVDFAQKDYSMKKTLKKYLVYRSNKKSEKRVVERADALIVLTEADRSRMMELYSEAIKAKMTIVPVCLEAKEINRNRLDIDSCKKNEIKSRLKILITGSLWFGGNYKGILWFLEQVYPKLNFDFELIIAGSKPSDELKKIVYGKENVRLIDSPLEMEPYFTECDIVAAPVFDGAGMKVKVAEAFSYGKPVVGTSHAFIGYEIGESKYAYVADCAEDFCRALSIHSSLTLDERQERSNAILSLFLGKYSMKQSAREWNKIMEGNIEGYGC